MTGRSWVAVFSSSAVFWVFGQLLSDRFGGWFTGVDRALSLIMFLGTIPLMVLLTHRWNRRLVLSKGGLAVLLLAVVALFVGHLMVFSHHVSEPRVNDIATATLAAGNVLLEGINPYVAPIDPQPELGHATWYYHGFKYMPLMAIMYLPLGALGGASGLLVANLLLDVLLLLLLYLVGRRLASPAVGLLAGLLYLLLPLMSHELFFSGSTDIAVIVFLVTALLLVEERPGSAGFLIGLSLATKPFPGLFFALAFFPRARRFSYVQGMVLGMMPIAAFLALSPRAFVANTVLFGTVARSVDPTSWHYGLWSVTGAIAGGLFLGLLAVAAFFVLRRKPSLIVRLAWYVVLVFGALLSGPANHGNYQIWWVPFFAVLVAVAVSRRWGNSSPSLVAPTINGL